MSSASVTKKVTGQLTERQRQVAELVAEGLSNKEIATRLVLNTQTVKTYVSYAMRSTDTHNRVQLARYIWSGSKPWDGS